jgi:hypothetical protein
MAVRFESAISGKIILCPPNADYVYRSSSNDGKQGINRNTIRRTHG